MIETLDTKESKMIAIEQWGGGWGGGGDYDVKTQ